MLSLPQPQRRRRPSLTPMIDVVFLLLVFFMLAARFGAPDAIGTGIAGSGGDWSGPPRLVTLRPGTLLLNGQPVAADALPAALLALMQTPTDPVLLRPEAGADVQALLDLMTQLRAAGLTGLSVVE
ncbi:biopolymer transporter ExbD [Thalassococcus profundi]|uniref:Biopolymer transporter ExbD n=1 Tax=Thalassococcus profundi TaxID=2282382 RepID=A0A369TQ25_9RHOB|nr:biopolymer transporter ExbD [Thalassococcus profundi]RDD66972.1 biopolymer transporter ExbD [Thalassococcus profundi]